MRFFMVVVCRQGRFAVSSPFPQKMEEQSDTPTDTPTDIQRVLVTGGAGFIGSHTCDRLLAMGKEVLAVDDLSTGHLSNLADAQTHDRFTFREADVADPEQTASAFDDFEPDAVVHLAALVSVPLGESERAKNFRLNVAATQAVADAARTAVTQRIVFASSAAVYGNSNALPLVEDGATVPISQYGAAKLMSEQLLAAYATSYGLAATCFRFFNVYGPRQDPSSPYSGVVSIFADRYRAGQSVTVNGDGKQSRDFIFVKDLAKAVAESAVDPTLPGGVYNLCTGNSTTLLDLIDILQEDYPEVAAPTFGPDRAGDIKHSLGNPGAAKSCLAVENNTPFANGIRELLASLDS
jgi:UDP-glucose 4-epimerase